MTINPMRKQEVRNGVRRVEMVISPVRGLSPLKLRCNVYAIETESGITLFDCGPEEDVATLKSALTTERISQVFLTHGHADHAGSSRYWLKEGARVFGPEEEATMLRSGGPDVALQAFRYPGFEPTGIVHPGDRIALDREFDFVVLSTPGHTPGSVCYYDEHKDILISGDLLFGPIGGYMVTFLLEFLTALRQPDADLQRQIESLESLVNSEVLKNTTLILPGHGPGYHMQEKPGAVKRTLRLLQLCLRL